MRKAASLLIGGILAIMVPNIVDAAPVTVNFTLEVDAIDDGGGLMLGGPVQKDDKITGRLTWDTDTPDEDSNPGVGVYNYSVSPIAEFILNTPSSIVASALEFRIENDVNNYDSFDLFGVMITDTIGIAFADLSFFSDVVQLWSSDALPQGGLDAATLGQITSYFSLSGVDSSDNRHDVYAHLVAFGPGDPDPNPAAVPEPASLMLLGTGLIGVARWGVRRRRD